MKNPVLSMVLVVLLIGCSRPSPSPKDASKVRGGVDTSAPVNWGIYPGLTLDSLVSKSVIDLDSDGVPDTILFYQSRPEWNDPGDFHRIDFALSTKGTSTFIDTSDGWDFWQKETLDSARSELASLDLLHCREAVLLRTGASDYAMFLVAPAYASTPPALTVFHCRRDGIQRVNVGHLDIDHVADVDRDGQLEIIGTKGAEVWGGSDSVGGYETYSPFEIFTLPTCEPKAKSFVRQYNLDHYYGYDDSGEPCVVVHLRNGAKPFVMKEKEAYAKYGE
jgi:hypothetical protein